MALPRTPEPSSLTVYERYEMRRMRRDAMKGCPFNPRVISNHSQELLRKNIAQKGLLQPVVYNLPTDYLISGHQRLAILDALEGRHDYELSVAVTQLSEADAKAQVVFFNNPIAQGQWDLDQFLELVKAPDVDVTAMGLEVFDLQMLFPTYDLAGLGLETAPPVADTSPAATEAGERLAEIKEIRKRGADKLKASSASDYYLVVVFPDGPRRERFLTRLALDPIEKYLNCAVLEAALWPEHSSPEQAHARR